MRVILATATALVLSLSFANAQSNMTAQRFGNTTYYNDFNTGYRGTAQTYGNTTYYRDSEGNVGTAQTYGNTTYFHDFNLR